MEAESIGAVAKQQHQDAEEARAKSVAAKESDAAEAEQADLNTKTVVVGK